jgi:MerR family transcriptional regulator, light-induced transcriptional regulator
LDESGSGPEGVHPWVEGAGPPTLGDFAVHYLDALRSASLLGAVEVVEDALSRGVRPSVIHSDVIRPAMVAVGDLWAEGALTVGDEHLATAITQRVMARLVDVLRTVPRSSRERVVLAAPAGEHHDVGLRMAGDLLEGAGFTVLYAGPNVPARALAAIVAEHSPAVTALTCTCTGDSLFEAVEAVSASTRIVLGGQGVPAGLRDAGHPWLACSTLVVPAVERLLAGSGESDERAAAESAVTAASRRRRKRTSPLTPRQREVLEGLAEGKSTEQIATELVLTPVTVRNHVANILAALGVHSRLEAVVTARRRGLID